MIYLLLWSINYTQHHINNYQQLKKVFNDTTLKIFQYAGDTRYARLHLDRLKEDCRAAVTTNTSLWSVDATTSYPLPPQDIVDFLCLNDCSGHGQCSKGEWSTAPQ